MSSKNYIINIESTIFDDIYNTFELKSERSKVDITKPWLVMAFLDFLNNEKSNDETLDMKPYVEGLTEESKTAIYSFLLESGTPFNYTKELSVLLHKKDETEEENEIKPNSSFFLFSKKNRQRVNEMNPNANALELEKILKSEYNALSEEEKTEYGKVVNNGKASAFILFANKHRPIVKEMNPNASFGQVGKILGGMWREMPVEKKDEWKNYSDVC